MSTRYSTGPVSGWNSIDPLAGIEACGTATNSCWDVASSGQTTSAGDDRITDLAMRHKWSFAKLAFERTCGIDEIVCCPWLFEK